MCVCVCRVNTVRLLHTLKRCVQYALHDCGVNLWEIMMFYQFEVGCESSKHYSSYCSLCFFFLIKKILNHCGRGLLVLMLKKKNVFLFLSLLHF